MPPDGLRLFCPSRQIRPPKLLQKTVCKFTNGYHYHFTASQLSAEPKTEFNAYETVISPIRLLPLVLGDLLDFKFARRVTCRHAAEGDCRG